MAKATGWMKNYANQKRRPLFQVRDKVLLKLTSQIQKQLIRTNVNRSLVHNFEVLKNVGNVPYRLLLLYRMKIHPTFHVIFLQPFHEDVENPN